MKCHEPGNCSLLWRTVARGFHETQSEIDPRCRRAPDRRREHRTHRPGAGREFHEVRPGRGQGLPRRRHPAADTPAPEGRTGRPRTRRQPVLGLRQDRRGGLPHRPPGPEAGEAGRRPHRAHPDGQGRDARRGRGAGRVPPVQRKRRAQGGDRQDGAGEPRSHQGRVHRQDGRRPGHPRAQTDQGREDDQGRLQALRAVRVQPARARVDHAGDDPCG